MISGSLQTSLFQLFPELRLASFRSGNPRWPRVLPDLLAFNRSFVTMLPYWPGTGTTLNRSRKRKSSVQPMFGISQPTFPLTHLIVSCPIVLDSSLAESTLLPRHLSYLALTELHFDAAPSSYSLQRRPKLFNSSVLAALPLLLCRVVATPDVMPGVWTLMYCCNSCNSFACLLEELLRSPLHFAPNELLHFRPTRNQTHGEELDVDKSVPFVQLRGKRGPCSYCMVRDLDVFFRRIKFRTTIQGEIKVCYGLHHIQPDGGGLQNTEK